MYRGNRTGLTQRGRGDYRVSGVQGEMPVRKVFRRQRLFPLRVVPLFFYFQIAQHGYQHNEYDTAQTTADYQSQSPSEYRTFLLFVRVERHVALQGFHLSATAALSVVTRRKVSRIVWRNPIAKAQHAYQIPGLWRQVVQPSCLRVFV